MPCSDKFFTGGTQKVACRWGRGAEDRDLHLTEQQHAIVGASPQPAANGWGRRSRERRSSKLSLTVSLRYDDGPVNLVGPLGVAVPQVTQVLGVQARVVVGVATSTSGTTGPPKSSRPSRRSPRRTLRCGSCPVAPTRSRLCSDQSSQPRADHPCRRA